jgi:hypothetical protein
MRAVAEPPTRVETLASWWKATDEGVEQLEQHVPLRLRPERGESFSLGPGITRRLVLLQIDGSMLTSEGHPTTSIGTLPQVGPITYDTTYYLCLVTTALDADPLYVTGSFCVVLRHRSDAEARLTIRWDGPHDAMWLERQVAAASGN